MRHDDNRTTSSLFGSGTRDQIRPMDLSPPHFDSLPVIIKCSIPATSRLASKSRAVPAVSAAYAAIASCLAFRTDTTDEPPATCAGCPAQTAHSPGRWRSCSCDTQPGGASGRRPRCRRADRVEFGRLERSVAIHAAARRHRAVLWGSGWTPFSTPEPLLEQKI